MDEREGFEAQQEAKREAAGATSRMTRDRIWEGLTKYLAAEARHAQKTATPETESEKPTSAKRDEDRRKP